MSSSSADDTIRVAVIDDHPLLRDGIVYAFRDEPDLDVVAEGESAAEAIDVAARQSPDVMLLDINMPGGGLEALRLIGEASPGVKVVVLTVRDDAATVARALRASARGYVLKGISGRNLARAIRAVHQGDIYITPSLATQLLSNEAGHDYQRQLALLTDREKHVLRLIARGLLNKQIGGELKLSEKTIKHHVTAIFQKLQVHNRVEAALIGQHELRPLD